MAQVIGQLINQIRAHEAEQLEEMEESGTVPIPWYKSWAIWVNLILGLITLIFLILQFVVFTRLRRDIQQFCSRAPSQDA